MKEIEQRRDRGESWKKIGAIHGPTAEKAYRYWKRSGKLKGCLAVKTRDGSEEHFNQNDVMMLPPGHDAWCVGEEPAVFVEFSRGRSEEVIMRTTMLHH